MARTTSPEELVPHFFLDLDGTLIDTNSNEPGSAKYRETLDIVRHLTGSESLDMAVFDEFYRAFNTQVVDLSMDDASRAFLKIAPQHYPRIGMEEKAFVTYRAQERDRTYLERARWIGSAERHAGTWLSEVPKGWMELAYLVTSASPKTIGLLSRNPHIRTPEGSGLVDIFENRIITTKDIKHVKPDPEAYNLALAYSQPEPSPSGFAGIAFEDSRTGILAARAANFMRNRLYVVGLESSLTPNQLLEYGAHMTARALHEVRLPEVLEQAGYTARPGK